jgi:hypothetical protein
MDVVIDTELCDYVQVRHTKLEPAAPEASSPTGQQKQARQPQLPSKFYKVQCSVL